MLRDFIDQRLAFDTVAPGVLGTNRKGATLVAMLDYDTASRFSDIAVKHIQVRNTYPQIPAHAGNYKYGKFTYPDGTVEYLGEPWIVAASIKAVQVRKLVFTIEEDVTEDTESKARAAWLSNGISKFTVETIS